MRSGNWTSSRRGTPSPRRLWAIGAVILGIVLGILGIFGISVNYPIYKKLLERGKQKYAFEIMELAKEISEQ